MSNIISVTDASFDAEVLQSDQPVLVDFWAEWCGPCKMIAPILEEISGEYGDKLKIVKIDCDANPDTPANMGVRGIPTLTLFNAGDKVAQQTGALSKSQLSAFIDSNL